jgi:alanine racemase
MFAPARARFHVNVKALAQNYARLRALAGAADCGAAVKANAYGVGIDVVVPVLERAGARSFFVATIAEAQHVRALSPASALYMLGGVLPGEEAALLAARIWPVLNSLDQVALWRGTGAPCAVMVDTGIHRLGLHPADWQALDSRQLDIRLLLSHLANADSPTDPMHAVQLGAFQAACALRPDLPASLANSGGLALGAAFTFDAVRPGLALYGGQPWPGALSGIADVVTWEAQVLQIATLPAGAPVGYGGSWCAPAGGARIATIALGYADGYLRAFSNCGIAAWGEHRFPVVGRVSMDLVTLDVTAAPALAVGDWVTLLGGAMPLAEASARSGLSQYELLTLAGARYDRQVHA